MLRASAILLLVAIAGCGKPSYDTATPDATLDSAVAMVRDGRIAQLPDLIEIPSRDVTFDDGVTEASAITEVKAKAGSMLARA
ncbi:MAG: hypothetical protein ACKPEA_07520, partial [Planctomycetota bacterium]